jgi:O-antigen/teichoic acid export membrane protein
MMVRTSKRLVLPAGLLDAGFASLTTFAVGVYAARVLPPAQFGAYALFLSAFLLAAVVPAQLILNPAQNFSVARPPVERLCLLSQTWRLGLLPAFCAAVAATTAASLITEAPAAVRWPLALTMACCATASPLQDHVRRCLHLGGVSWRAAAVSLVQFLSVVMFLALLEQLDIADVWKPFGALTLANVASSSVGFLLTRHELRTFQTSPYRIREVVRSGRWLLGMESATTVAAFLTSALITRFASAETLGYAEAARLIAQPIMVLVAGLSAVLGPQLLEAGGAFDGAWTHRVTQRFIGLLLVAAVLYGAVTIVPWPGNVLALLVPGAYTVKALVTMFVFAYVFTGIAMPYRYTLVATRREHVLPWAAVVAGALQSAVAMTAGMTGAFAQPLGIVVFGLVLSVAYWHHTRVMFKSPRLALDPEGLYQ